MRRARIGSIGRRPTSRTGGGMKLPTKKVRPPKPTDTGGRVVTPKKKPPIRGPKPTDTGGRVVMPKKKPPIRPPKPTDTGGRVVTPKKRPPTPRVSDTGTGLRRPRRAFRNGNDGLTPVRRRRMVRPRRAPMRRGR